MCPHLALLSVHWRPANRTAAPKCLTRSASWRPVLRQCALGTRRGGQRRRQHPAVVAGATTAWHLRQGWLQWHEQSAHVQCRTQGVASMAARSNPLCRSRAFKALHAKTGPTVGSTRTLTVGIAPDMPYGRRLTWRWASSKKYSGSLSNIGLPFVKHS
jgi:hypothetical protein